MYRLDTLCIVYMCSCLLACKGCTTFTKKVTLVSKFSCDYMSCDIPGQGVFLRQLFSKAYCGVRVWLVTRERISAPKVVKDL